MIQLIPPERISERIMEQVVDVPVPQFPASIACSTSLFSPPGGVATCGAEFARQVEISTLGSHQMAVPGQRRTVIHAESSSNGSSRPAAHNSSTPELSKSLVEASVKKKSRRLQKHKNSTRSQCRCCRNRNTKVARSSCCSHEVQRPTNSNGKQHKTTSPRGD